MQLANCMSAKCEDNNFRVANCDSGNFRVVSYNLTSLWFASCELIIRLGVGDHISLHYIKSALSVYIVSSLHVKESKNNKVIWYILIIIYLWQQPYDLLWFTEYLQKQLFTTKEVAVQQILENPEESNYCGVLF